MIKIERIECPIELTGEVQLQKTSLYKINPKESVWSEEYIKNALLNMSHGKCAYCECRLEDSGRYMEVEHFHDKSNYPDEVVVWENLLPSCKTCNTHKGTHDTYIEPIINPTVDRPQDHMALHMGCRWRKKDDMGDLTIIVLDLNNQRRHIKYRYEVADAISKKVEELLDLMKSYVADSPKVARKRFKLVNSVREIFEFCSPTETYAAIKATTLLNDSLYVELIQLMKQESLWSEEFESYHQTLANICYDVM